MEISKEFNSTSNKDSIKSPTQSTESGSSSAAFQKKQASTSTSTSSSSSLLSSFDSYSDDISSWLNNSISKATSNSQSSSSTDSLTSLSQHLQDLSFQLHLNHSKATSQSSNQINQLSNSIPKLSSQINHIATSAGKSLSKLNALQQQSEAFAYSEDEEGHDNPFAGNDFINKVNGTSLGEQRVESERIHSTQSLEREARVSRSLQRLATLSKLSQRLSDSRNVLRDAEKWNSLSFDVKSALKVSPANDGPSQSNDYLLPSLTPTTSSTSASSEPDLILASQHLSLAQSSLSFFSNSATHQSRSNLLNELLESFQDIVKNKLNSILHHKPINRDLAMISKLSMRRIGKEELWLDWWMAERSQNLRNDWNQVKLLEESQPQTVDGTNQNYRPSFQDWLPIYWNELMSLLNEEKLIQISMDESNVGKELDSAEHFQNELNSSSPSSSSVPQTQCSKRNHSDLLIRFLEYVLKNLNPSLSDRIWKSYSYWNSKLTEDHKGGLASLVSVNESIKEFSISFDQVLKKLDSSQKNGKGRSTRLFSSWHEELFKPLLTYFSSYDQLERNELLLSFNSDESSAIPESENLSSLLPQSFKSKSERSLSLSRSSITRSNSLTLNLKSVSNSIMIDSFFSTNLSEDLDYLKRFLSSQQSKFSNPAASSSSLEDQMSSSGNVEEEEIDWEKFKILIQMLDLNQNLWNGLEELRLAWLKERTSSLEELHQEVNSALRREEEGEDDGDEDSEFNTKRDRLMHKLKSLSERFGAIEGHLAYFLICMDPRDSSTVDKQLLLNPRISSTPVLSQIFPQAAKTLLLHLRFLHQYVHTILLSPLLFILKHYPDLSQWASNASSSSTMKNEYELNLPSFSLSNTEEMNKLIENCLNLPRLLEWGLGGDGGQFLGFGHEWLRGGRLEQEERRRQRDREREGRVKDGLQSKESGNRRKSLVAGSSSSISQTVLFGGPTSSKPLDGSSSIDLSVPGGTISKDSLLPIYLRSLLEHLLFHFTFETLPKIKSLSESGKNQLKTDLEGLDNILEALGMIEDGEQEIEHVDGEEYRDDVGRKGNGLRRLKLFREILDLEEEVSIRLLNIRDQNQSTEFRNLAQVSLEKSKTLSRREGKEARGESKAQTSREGEETETNGELVLNERIQTESERLKRLRRSEVFGLISKMRGWERGNARR